MLKQSMIRSFETFRGDKMCRTELSDGEWREFTRELAVAPTHDLAMQAALTEQMQEDTAERMLVEYERIR